MNMADVICLAIHLYSLVGKQCASSISEDMRFQVFIYNHKHNNYEQQHWLIRLNMFKSGICFIPRVHWKS